jgi:hypothetical protein
MVEVLSETNVLSAVVEEVQAIMATDPTMGTDLANLFRLIEQTKETPSIGVFNAGYENLMAEMVVTGQERLPYIGYTDDWKFGSEAGTMTLALLPRDIPVKPICFNARPDLAFVGQRCAQYYQTVTNKPPFNDSGVTCSGDSNVQAVADLLRQGEINAVYTHGDCCAVVGQAIQMLRAEDASRTIVAGCMDEDTSNGGINFITTQPIELQAVQAYSWTTLPVIQTDVGGDGETEQFFLSERTLIDTAIFSEVIFI